MASSNELAAIDSARFFSELVKEHTKALERLDKQITELQNQRSNAAKDLAETEAKLEAELDKIRKEPRGNPNPQRV